MESNKTETNKTETNKTETNKTETNKTETNKTETNKTETNKTESNKTEANKTEDDLQKLFDKLEKWGAEPREVLDETFMNDTGFFYECLEKFTHETSFQTLPALLVPGKKDEAIRIVHTIKGNADSLGLFPVMDAAMVILKDLRADNIPKVIADLPLLEKIFAEFCNLISSEL